jgi:FdhD protein
VKRSSATILPRPVVKVDLKSGRRERTKDAVAIDLPYNIYLNADYVTTVFALPTKLNELAVGYLVDEGILNTKEEISKIWVRGLDIKVKTRNRRKTSPSTRLHSFKSYKELLARINYIDSKVTVPAEQVLQSILKLTEMSMTFNSTGGTHSAAIFHVDGKISSFSEDVGRHNSIDKVIGESILSGVNLSQCLLVSTARQSAGMVLKVARVGIPILVSKAGPLLSGIDVAEKTGVTLICFVRENRMNIYTHLERLVF